MKTILTALFIFAAVLTAALAQSNEVMDFLGIEIGSDWQSVSNQHPEAELADWFLHTVKYDAPFKIYTIQINNSEYPFATNAELAVYQDIIAYTTFRFSVPSEKEYFELRSSLITNPLNYLSAPLNTGSFQYDSCIHTNRTRPIEVILTYDGEDKAVQLQAGFADYNEVESQWRIKAYNEGE